MSRVVRSSKYRHVFGEVLKKEKCYDELKITRTAHDANFVSASPLYFAVMWEAAGGGAAAVIPWDKYGKEAGNVPVINGHKEKLTDLEFSPFHDNILATASEDCYGKVWKIPDGGLKDNIVDNPAQTLLGHKRKLMTVRFNPVGDNVVATSSADLSVKVWDIEVGAAKNDVAAQHSDLIQSCEWNFGGSLLATTCKDKKLRIIDPRANSVTSEVECHLGVKGSRCLWLGEKEKVFTSGFSKTSDREICFWDPKKLTEPLKKETIDQSSGVLMPFYDNDCALLYLAGKGDGNIRYYEIVDEAPYYYYLSEFKSATPQRGLCNVPKRMVNVSECEVDRMLKLSVKMMEPVSFCVPRKSDIFQDDIYPNAFNGETDTTASQWFGGKNGKTSTVSLQGGFVYKPKADVSFTKAAEEAKPLTEFELKEALTKAETRIAYLEAELVKRDAKIKDLEAKK